MPDWKNHLIMSLLLLISWVFVLQSIGFEIEVSYLFSMVLFSLFVSLFPDVDIKSSKARHITSLAISSIALLSYLVFYSSTWYYGPAYFIILYLVLKYVPTKHRGLTHGIPFAFIFSLSLTLVYLTITGDIVYGISEKSVVMFLIIMSNYVLHIFLDNM